MSDQAYNYSIANDFPGSKVNTAKLQSEIQKSAIVTALSHINTDGDQVSIIFRAALSVGDKTILDGDATGPAGGLIAAHDNTSSNSIAMPVNFADANGNPIATTTDADGKTPIFVQRKSGATKFNAFSQNWCDKTTWCNKSVQVTNETLQTSDNTNFTSPNNNLYWIDTKHGKVFNERIFVKNNNNKWVVAVTVDGTPVTECKPGQPDSGDYTVDYKNGTVVFNNSLGAGHTVVASYWYSPDAVQNSMWYVSPPAGMKLELLRVEVQFTKDIEIRDTVIFQAYGWVDAYAPQLMQSPYNLPSHTLIPLGDPIEYKTVTDFVAESNGAQPIIYAFGGNYEGGWRALAVDVYTLVWDYVSRTDIVDGTGFCIGVCLENDRAFGGTYATATLYSLQEPK